MTEPCVFFLIGLIAHMSHKEREVNVAFFTESVFYSKKGEISSIAYLAQTGMCRPTGMVFRVTLYSFLNNVSFCTGSLEQGVNKLLMHFLLVHIGHFLTAVITILFMPALGFLLLLHIEIQFSQSSFQCHYLKKKIFLILNRVLYLGSTQGHEKRSLVLNRVAK